jgi:hypothetical protein
MNGLQQRLVSQLEQGEIMNKIDLIVDALQNCSAFQPKNYYEIDKALAAAYELKALQPVGVFEYDEENKVWEELMPNCEGVKLYALNEVTK